MQVGKDANGTMLRTALQNEGVNTDHIREVDGRSSTAVRLEQPSGKHRTVTVSRDYRTRHCTQMVESPSIDVHVSRWSDRLRFLNAQEVQTQRPGI